MNAGTVGLDIGKRSIEAIRLVDGEKPERFRSGTDAGGLVALVGWLRQGDRVFLEAGSQAFRIARMIQTRIESEVFVLNPGDLATIYMSLKKTDREDCLKLARLAQRIPVEELPTVKIPDETEEAHRRLCTEEMFLAEQIADFKNRLHSVFTEAGLIHVTRKHLASTRNRESELADLPVRFRREADRIHAILNQLEEKQNEVKAEIKNVLRENISYTALAMSMPGIGPVTVFALLAYLGKCERFSRGAQVGYYVGLVPRVDISGDQVRYGRILSRGCQPIRRTIIQAAWALTRSKNAGPLKDFFERLKARKGSKKAIVATARKMLETLYTMIKTGELYRYGDDDSLNRKLVQYGLV